MEARGAAAFLERMAEGGASGVGRERKRKLDVVFLDPPWEAVTEYGAVLGVLGGGVGRRVLAEGGVVVAEHASRTALAERFGDLRQTRTLKQGDAGLSFYKLVDAEGNQTADVSDS